jgi:hypothetical protein
LGVVRRRPPWIPDALGVLWVVGAAVAVCIPALAHGASLGPFDLLSRFGLTRAPGIAVHNTQVTDQIAEMIPWTAQAWTQVHHGHLPLWNPYSGLGMPLAFNWQSATFSAPTLLGYLAPLHLAYTVQVIVTFIIAGTGVYVFSRVLGLSALAAATAGTVFELCGPMLGFSGWPIAAVMSWAGWIFAAAVLVVRGRRRAYAITFLAVVLAASVYAGQPGALALVVAGLVVFLAVWLALRATSFGGHTPAMRPVVDLSVAAVAGVGLSAPLLLPGFQLLSTSVFRSVQHVNEALPLQDAVYVMVQGFNGQTLTHGQFFSVGTTAYVGVIPLVLVTAGIACRRQRPEVLALAAVGVFMAAVAYVSPVLSILNALPLRARWHVSMVMLCFALAVLAGVGMDCIVRWRGDDAVLTWTGIGLASCAFVLMLLWLFGRGHLPRANAHIRDQSFLWPAAQCLLGLAVIGAMWLFRRRHRTTRSTANSDRLAVGAWAGALLLACETAFLLGVGAQVWSSSPSFLPSTPAVAALQRAVGQSVVGFGARSCQTPPTLGILEEANAGYGIREFAAYDPLTPRAAFRSWQTTSGQPASSGLPVSVFCPVVTSAAIARQYGVAFLLEPRGQPGPPGTQFEATLDDEALYRVPGTGAAVFISSPSAQQPAPSAAGSTLTDSDPDPATWRLAVNAPTSGVVRVHVTDVPGWHATVDGRTVAVRASSGAMTLDVRVPPGRHVVVLRYWPTAFSVGIALAVCSALGLIGACAVSARRHAKRPRPQAAAPRHVVSATPLVPR